MTQRTVAVLPTLATLPTVGLGDVVATAELLDRVDRKYLVTPDVVESACRRVADRARVLEIDERRSFGYRSVYFDTPDLRHYLAAARRRPVRSKVRIRTYSDAAESYVEVKVRDRRGRTVKHRLPTLVDRAWVLTPDEVRFAASRCDESSDDLAQLRPALETTYRRTTMLVDGQRVTIDVGLRCRVVHPRGAEATAAGDPAGICAEVGIGELVVVETKSADHRAGGFDRVLWHAGIRPLRFSKYAVGMAALHPDLPANAWHRSVRHMDRSARLDPASSIPLDRESSARR